MARRFGRKLQTPFIGFGKEQSHESLGRSERPSDRGRPRMRNRPPSLAIQILAESTKEGAEDFSKPMAAWTPLFFYQTLAPARSVRETLHSLASLSAICCHFGRSCGGWRCRYEKPRQPVPILDWRALALRRLGSRRGIVSLREGLPPVFVKHQHFLTSPRRICCQRVRRNPSRKYPQNRCQRARESSV
jgi:hypothetical protein